MSNQTPLAAYEAAIAAAKLAEKNMLAALGLWFSEAYDCGEYTALNGNGLFIDAIEVVTGEWRVGKPKPAEAYEGEYVVATVSKADPAYQNGERVLGRIDSVRLSSNGDDVAYVVRRTDGYDNESAMLVILSADKEISP